MKYPDPDATDDLSSDGTTSSPKMIVHEVYLKCHSPTQKWANIVDICMEQSKGKRVLAGNVREQKGGLGFWIDNQIIELCHSLEGEPTSSTVGLVSIVKDKFACNCSDHITYSSVV